MYTDLENPMVIGDYYDDISDPAFVCPHCREMWWQRDDDLYVDRKGNKEETVELDGFCPSCLPAYLFDNMDDRVLIQYVESSFMGPLELSEMAGVKAGKEFELFCALLDQEVFFIDREIERGTKPEDLRGMHLPMFLKKALDEYASVHEDEIKDWLVERWSA